MVEKFQDYYVRVRCSFFKVLRFVEESVTALCSEGFKLGCFHHGRHWYWYCALGQPLLSSPARRPNRCGVASHRIGRRSRTNRWRCFNCVALRQTLQSERNEYCYLNIMCSFNSRTIDFSSYQFSSIVNLFIHNVNYYCVYCNGHIELSTTFIRPEYLRFSPDLSIFKIS